MTKKDMKDQIVLNPAAVCVQDQDCEGVLDNPVQILLHTGLIYVHLLRQRPHL